MPVYEFKLEAQDGSGEYRRGRVAAETKAEARDFLENRERQYCAFRLGQELEETRRAHRVIHEQTEPYKLVKLEKV